MSTSRQSVRERIAKLTFFVEPFGESNAWLAAEITRQSGFLDVRRDALVQRLSGRLGTRVNLYEVTLALLDHIARDERFVGKVRFYQRYGKLGATCEMGARAVQTAISVA